MTLASPPRAPAKWKQGEHVLIVGDTGSGKTYLESKLLDLRDFTIIVKTKPDDIKFPGYERIKKYTGLGNLKSKKFILDAGFDPHLQRYHILRTLDLIWKQEGWTLGVDEAYYWTRVLKLENNLNMLLTQGRSKKVTMVVGMQRPAWISRFALSQATHAFIFRCEGRDIQSLAEALSPQIKEPVSKLRGHDFVYFNRATRDVVTGNANKLSEVIVRG